MSLCKEHFFTVSHYLTEDVLPPFWYLISQEAPEGGRGRKGQNHLSLLVCVVANVNLIASTAVIG